jgi:DNA polymerase III epsilon subunit-like protein
MKIMVYDIEASGLDLLGSYIMELAWAVFDLDTWRCLSSESYLVRWGKEYPVEPEASAVTGLNREFCEKLGRPVSYVLGGFEEASEYVDFLCGHNVISYDKPLLASNIKRAESFSCIIRKNWESVHHIDTLLDCPFPSTQKIHTLKYLALDHGYVLSGAHEAIHDVFACAHILKQYPFEKVLEISKTPLVTLTAKVAWEDLEGRDRIKNSRFYWNSNTKRWEKRIREYWLPGIQMQLGTAIELGITQEG